MGDWLMDVLYWLRDMGKPNLLPVAQRAEDRYANSERFTGHEGFGIYPTEGIRQIYTGQPGSMMLNADVMPAEIFRYVTSPGDTTYVETPTRSDSKYGLIRRYERRASTKSPKGNEYKTLRRRYKTAEKLAKPQ